MNHFLGNQDQNCANFFGVIYGSHSFHLLIHTQLQKLKVLENNLYVPLEVARVIPLLKRRYILMHVLAVECTHECLSAHTYLHIIDMDILYK